METITTIWNGFIAGQYDNEAAIKQLMDYIVTLNVGALNPKDRPFEYHVARALIFQLFFW